MRNLQEQVKKAFCYHKLFWTFIAWINCSRILKHFANSQPSVSNFKSFSRSLEHFFLTVGHNNLGNKIHFFWTIAGVARFHNGLKRSFRNDLCSQLHLLKGCSHIIFQKSQTHYIHKKIPAFFQLTYFIADIHFFAESRDFKFMRKKTIDRKTQKRT